MVLIFSLNNEKSAPWRSKDGFLNAVFTPSQTYNCVLGVKCHLLYINNKWFISKLASLQYLWKVLFVYFQNFLTEDHNIFHSCLLHLLLSKFFCSLQTTHSREFCWKDDGLYLCKSFDENIALLSHVSKEVRITSLLHMLLWPWLLTADTVVCLQTLSSLSYLSD